MGNIESFLSLLKAKKITLKVNEGELKVSAPKGTLTPEITGELKSRKDELIKLISSVVSQQNNGEIKRADRNKNMPLSFSQQRMWFLNQLEGEKAIYHIPFALKVEGILNYDKLEYALNEIIKRHETLRTIFPAVDGKPVQKILTDFKLKIEYSDLTGKIDLNDEAHIKLLLKDNITIPFSLAKGPVFRSYLYKLDINYHILLIVVHGIVADGWSAGVLFRELGILYEHDPSNKYPLEKLDIQFADFAVWQIEQYDNKIFEPQLQYWKKQLENIPGTLDFPFDFQRKAVHDFAGERIFFSVDQGVTKKLHALLKESGTSAFMLLWGVYAYLLYRYTGQHDILIGAPVANRTKSELEKLIGFFANTLVMRAKIDPDVTFRQYLEHVKQVSIEALANQDLPFDKLVEEIAPNRSLAHSPLFQTMFVLQNVPMNIGKETGLKISPIEVETNIAHFDIMLIINEFEREIRGFVEINTTLIKTETGKRLLQHFKNVLAKIADNPDKKLSDIDLISDEEKEIIFNKWNKQLNGNINNKNIIELLAGALSRNAEKDSIVFEGKALSYNDFSKKVNQLTGYLKEQGVKSNDVVAVMLNRSIDLIVSITAILKCGAAYLPVDPEYPSERIRTILNESKTGFIISSGNEINKFGFINAKNLRVLDKTEYIVTKTREVINELDDLPLPDRGSIDYSKYAKFIGTGPASNDISILASRGCPYNCLYCHKIWPKKQLIRNSENIFEEVKRYYDCGVRRFTFLDDIFNLRKDVSGRFFEYAAAELPGVQFFFPNGLRADILTEGFIDLMVEAGTVDVALALESGSPRIQKLIRKNLNLDKFLHNIKYFAEKYPHVFLELQTMFGFPTETEEEALMTLDTIKKVKWIDFPNLHVLKIFPNSEIYQLAIENGVSEEAIRISSNLPYHALPETLPYSKDFARQFQARYMNEYFLNRERLLHVLPTQFKIFTVSEMVQKYDSFLPYEINSFEDILKYTGINKKELGEFEFVAEDKYEVKNINEKLRKYFPVQKPKKDSLRIMLLDVSNLFTSMHETMLHHQIEEPIGLMYLLANLRNKFGDNINGKIAKSFVDFDSFEEMKKMIADFKPQIIGFRTLSIYKDFFHKCISVTKQAFPWVNIIVGGPYSTSEYDSMLSDSNIDLAVIGEGEVTTVELVEKYIANGSKMPGEDILKEIDGIAFVPKGNHSKIKFDGFDRNVMLLDQYDWQKKEYNRVQSVNGELAYVLYTSGSTGIPKGVAMGRTGAANLINWHLSDPDLSIPMRTLQFASISFDVSFQEIFTTLTTGGTLYLIDEDLRRDPYELLLFIDKNKIERLFLPVVALQQLAVAAGDKTSYPSSLKQIITAGEQLKITKQVRSFFTNLKNCILINHYGPTESHVVTTYRLEGNPGDWTDLPPIGKSVPGVNIFLLDENYKPVPVGLKGEIFIAGESLAEGYYLKPGLTSERFINNKIDGMRLYKTGDIGRYLPDGNIEYLGRSDEQVKIRGFRVEPGEIEATINKLHGVQNSALIVSSSNSSGNSLTAFIQPAENGATTPEIIKDALERIIPGYMIPSKIIFIERIPVNSNGKINKKVLSQKLIDYKSSGCFEYNNEREELLINLWKDILNIEQLGINDDFFRAGGHSLLATQVVSRARNLFNVDLQLKSLFEYPTVRKFSQHISDKLEKKNNISKPVFMSSKEYDIIPISLNQKYFWELDKKFKGKNVNNISGAYSIIGKLSEDKFISSINKIIKRHEMLRTVFYEKDGGIYQKTIEIKNGVAYKDISDLDESERKKIIEEMKYEVCLRPFKLTEETTSRFMLIKTSCDEQILLYAVHHIAFDGWSLGLLINELNPIYSLNDNTEEQIPQPAINYPGYSIAQNKWIDKGNLQNQIKYWDEKLSGYAADEIEIIHEDDDLTTETKLIKIDADLTSKLIKICMTNDISLFMLLLTAFNELLTETIEKDDLIIGTYSAGREYPELENIIGCFVNILPLRITGLAKDNYAVKIGKIKKICLDAYQNSFSSAVPALKNYRQGFDNIIGTPGFMFILQNNAVGQPVIGNVDMQSIKLKHINSPFTLQCSVFNNNGTLSVAFTYNCAKYYHAEIEKLLFNYKNKLLSLPEFFS